MFLYKGGRRGVPVLGLLPEAERRGTHNQVRNIGLGTSKQRRVSPMKWRALYVKAVYVLLVLTSLIAAAGADWKWH